MSRELRAKVYVRMIERFLGGQTSVDRFAHEFFRAFQSETEPFGQKLYDPLNAVAMAAETYSPQAPEGVFDITEAELRRECEQYLAQLLEAIGDNGGA